MKNLFLFLLLLIILFGCNSTHEKSAFPKAASMLAPPPVTNNVSKEENQENFNDKRKLIKEGIVSFKTKDLVQTRTEILKAVEKTGGYISSDQENKQYDQLSNFLTIRVPVEHFDRLLQEISKGVEHFDRRDIEVKDVTEEFLDMEARVKAKKEIEKRYLDLVRQAKKVSEVLEIERELGQIRSDIESIEGRINFLRNSVGYSKLEIRFYKNVPGESGYSAKMRSAFENGWESFLFFLLMVIHLWPLVVICIGFFFLIYFYKKKKMKKSPIG